MSNELLLTEGSAVEFYRRYDEFKGRRFVINSAWQGNLPYSANLSNIRLLRLKMKGFGFELVKVVGSYKQLKMDIECNVGFVPKDMDEQEMLRFMFYYGKWFNQNGFFYTDIDDILWSVSTRQDSSFGPYGMKKRYKKFIKQEFVSLVSKFCELTYTFDIVKLVTD